MILVPVFSNISAGLIVKMLKRYVLLPIYFLLLSSLQHHPLFISHVT